MIPSDKLMRDFFNLNLFCFIRQFQRLRVSISLIIVSAFESHLKTPPLQKQIFNDDKKKKKTLICTRTIYKAILFHKNLWKISSASALKKSLAALHASVL